MSQGEAFYCPNASSVKSLKTLAYRMCGVLHQGIGVKMLTAAQMLLTTSCPVRPTLVENLFRGKSHRQGYLVARLDVIQL